jgi:hypothetical protein
MCRDGFSDMLGIHDLTSRQIENALRLLQGAEKNNRSNL